MLGLYDNFPENIHRVDNFTSTLSSQKLQLRLVQVLHDVNRRPFSFEEVSYPTVHQCTVIFEFGLADQQGFNYLDDEEIKRLFDFLKKSAFQLLDFFLAVRYYKGTAPRKIPLRFDYYLVRFAFIAGDSVEIRVFHERGPRYVSPEDLVNFMERQVNGASPRKVLKKKEES
jgi:hypothetical protein